MLRPEEYRPKDYIRDILGKFLGFRAYKVKVFKNALKNPERFKDIIKYTTAKWYGVKDFERFIILSRARTGSTLLQLMLNSHPAIHAKSEIFTRLYGSSVETVFNDIFAPHPKSIKAVGFKIFYNHPLDDHSETVWKEMEKMAGLRVIHLKRKNILRILLSEKVAQKTNVWGIKKEKKRIRPEEKKITFAAEELGKKFHQAKEWEIKYRDMFQSHPSIEVYYEDLINDPRGEFEKVIRFLDLPYVEPQIKLKKQNPENASSLIENFEMLQKSFAGTEWEQFFEDETI